MLQRCGEISRVFLGALGRLLDRIGSHLSLRARHGHGSLGLLVSQHRGRLGLIVQVARGRLSLTGCLADRGLGLLAHALGGGLSLFQHLGVDGLALLHGDLALGDKLLHQLLGLLGAERHGAHTSQEHVLQSIGNRRHFGASLISTVISHPLLYERPRPTYANGAAPLPPRQRLIDLVRESAANDCSQPCALRAPARPCARIRSFAGAIPGSASRPRRPPRTPTRRLPPFSGRLKLPGACVRRPRCRAPAPRRGSTPQCRDR